MRLGGVGRDERLGGDLGERQVSSPLEMVRKPSMPARARGVGDEVDVVLGGHRLRLNLTWSPRAGQSCAEDDRQRAASAVRQVSQASHSRPGQRRAYLLGKTAPMIHRIGKMKPMRPSTQWPLRKLRTAKTTSRTK